MNLPVVPSIMEPDSEYPYRAGDEVQIDEYLGVIERLQDYFLEFGEAEKGRDLEEMLDEVFAGHGGRKYLWHLFPSGPVTQGMRIAGLPVPPHSGDKGLGIVR